MGQRRDNGKGKQCGSHVDYVVEGALPSGSVTVRTGMAVPTRVTGNAVPIRPSKYMHGITVFPGGGSDGLDDIDADAVLFPQIAGWDAAVCTRSKTGMHSTLPQYDTADDYLREVPIDARRVVAWYVRWLETGKRVRELPDGFMRMLQPLRYEYLVLGRICDIAEKARLSRMRTEALERLAEYSADERIPVRQSAVAAAGKVLDHLDRRDEMEAERGASSSGGGGGITLSVNIAAMLGGAGAASVGGAAEVVDMSVGGEKRSGELSQ